MSACRIGNFIVCGRRRRRRPDPTSSDEPIGIVTAAAPTQNGEWWVRFRWDGSRPFGPAAMKVRSGLAVGQRVRLRGDGTIMRLGMP